MPIDDSDRIGEEHFTRSSPDYSPFDRDAQVSIGLAAGLMVLTVGLMWILQPTPVTDLVLSLSAGPSIYGKMLPPVLFSALLVVGRKVGIEAAVEEDYGRAAMAAGLLAGTYGVFGAVVLSLFAERLHAVAIALTSLGMIVVTILAAVVVFTSDFDFSHYEYKAAVFMTAGFVLTILGTFVNVDPVAMLGLAILLFGWILDLVYEIHMVSDANRSPLANGIGVYVAFMGAFVHLLQFVLRALSRSRS